MTTLATLPLSQMTVVPDLLAAPVGTVMITSEKSRDEQKIVIRSRQISASGSTPGLIMMAAKTKGYFVPDDACSAFVRTALDVTAVMPLLLTKILPGFRYEYDAVVRGDVWQLRDESGKEFVGLAINSSDEEESKVSAYAHIEGGRIGEIVPATRVAYLGQLDFGAGPAVPTLG
ncbi:hypothetical protein [Komagataeibacter medellinensis]|nr:hypothetical protein [Komagataeibacter medellinensis]